MINHHHFYDEFGLCFECDKPQPKDTNMTQADRYVINQLQNMIINLHNQWHMYSTETDRDLPIQVRREHALTSIVNNLKQTSSELKLD